MTPNLPRLQHLVTVLAKVDPAQLRMDRWECGSAACAAGWAGRDPQFNAQGFELRDGTVRFGKWADYGALTAFFDLSHDDANVIFDPAYYRNAVTPAQVIERVRAVIRQHQPEAI